MNSSLKLLSFATKLFRFKAKPISFRAKLIRFTTKLISFVPNLIRFRTKLIRKVPVRHRNAVLLMPFGAHSRERRRCCQERAAASGIGGRCLGNGAGH